jgi:hypothetical protein
LKKKTPNMASATSSMVRFAPLKVEFLKSERSSIGTRWRCSSSTKVASPTTATAKLARILVEPQP